VRATPELSFRLPETNRAAFVRAPNSLC
jgi:hypothetical protein